MAPLIFLLEADSKNEPPCWEEVRKAVGTAVELEGNASARISRHRREKVTQDLNKALLPMAKVDNSFRDALPLLFGTEFAKKAKDHIDQVKAMRATLPTKNGPRMFFRGPPPPSKYRGFARSGGQSFQYHRELGAGLFKGKGSRDMTKPRTDTVTTLTTSYKNILCQDIADMDMVPVVAP